MPTGGASGARSSSARRSGSRSAFGSPELAPLDRAASSSVLGAIGRREDMPRRIGVNPHRRPGRRAPGVVSPAAPRSVAGSSYAPTPGTGGDGAGAGNGEGVGSGPGSGTGSGSGPGSESAIAWA